MCLLGVGLSSAAVYYCVRAAGARAIDASVLAKCHFLQDEAHVKFFLFLLFFIPGTPKDVLTYVVGLTPMRLPTWVLITTVARIPSVITSTIGGDALGTENYFFAVAVFAATALISGVGVLVYRQITKHHQKKEQEREAAEKAGHNALDGSAV